MSNDDNDDKKREAEVAKNIQVAIVYGANELAKTAATLGEKVWWRMVREDALTRYHALGGVGEPEHGATILRLEYPQTIAFTANDIDLMRKCVAEHDKAMAITAVYTCYWNEDKSHAPYQHQLRTIEDKPIVQLPYEIAEPLGLGKHNDGDEIEITVRRTGRRPFGNRQIVWTKPHTYEREP